MTQAELYQELSKIGYPLAYSHFEEYQETPYMVYLFSYSSDLIADNRNYKDISNFSIELYTDKKDLVAEKKVEDKLKELELPYFKSETWIESESVFQVLYEIQLI